jgi:hypothetical protein
VVEDAAPDFVDRSVEAEMDIASLDGHGRLCTLEKYM